MADAVHTPGPWSLAAKKAGRAKAVIVADDTSSSTHMLCVAECFEVSSGDRPLAEANAAFIVKAVNAHDELVAALIGLVDASRAYLAHMDAEDMAAVDAAYAALKAGA